MARLLRLLRALAAGDARRGVAADQLIRIGDYRLEDQKAAMSSLQRDVRRLGDAGWWIENVAPAGSPARYVLHPNDLAERAGLTPGEQSVLEEALAALPVHPPEASEVAPPVAIATVRRAVDARCVLEMTYNGTLRRVHPMRLHNPPGRWLLRALDEHDGVVKWFLIHRIENPSLDDPGSARTGIDDPEDSLNPHEWRVDPPTEVELAVAPEHQHLVRHTLNLAVGHADGEVGERVEVTVTNRRAFMDWLVTMGERVVLLGPEDVRRDFLDRLEAVARG
ncbi:helix-turn-helix transcriptional regulator [Phycicoccus duodecadis]|uniref:Putative DNA-binding transcriptional regulator YafY n=1 Tax=Phycicoccus duodecadis TaxID=173053 RepID=A0A2N3YFV9_9MICO|nr:WYL domain-containing protein [Phycicoccus duodecadis]PKW25725.1 putative DNA-binding transcriptional regulator YafY [Phycicoccus duodecadis]